MDTTTKQSIGPVQERWLQALESEKYIQGKEYLRQPCDSGDAYCCLGVACEVYGLPSVPDARGRHIYGDERKVSTLPQAVKTGMGFIGTLGELTGGDINGSRSLSRANDFGASFAEIAAFCRANPEAVFTEPR